MVDLECHRDAYRRPILINDWVAYVGYKNKIVIGKVVKVTPKLVCIKELSYVYDKDKNELVWVEPKSSDGYTCNKKPENVVLLMANPLKLIGLNIYGEDKIIKN